MTSKGSTGWLKIGLFGRYFPVFRLLKTGYTACGERYEEDAMKEKNLGSNPEDPVKNLKAAEGKNVQHRVHNPGVADEVPGEYTARGRYGEEVEDLEAEDFYAASNKHPEEPEVGMVK
jgi:hypothetical protein